MPGFAAITPLTFILTAGAVAGAHAQGYEAAAETVVESATFDEVHERISSECYSAAMAVVEVSQQRVVCSTSLVGNEPFLEDTAFAGADADTLEQHVAFDLSRVDQDIAIRAQSWVESRADVGEGQREYLPDEEYVARLQGMLDDLSAEPGTAVRQVGVQIGWEYHFDSEEEYRLEAHHKAVDRCDVMMRTAASEEQATRDEEATAAAPPGQEDVRPAETPPAGPAPTGPEPGTLPQPTHGGAGGDRATCEQQQEEVFLWGLARGMEDPTLEEYLAGVPLPRHCPEGVGNEDC